MSIHPYGDHAYVTPKVVRWARERLRRTPEEAAARLGINPDRWKAWEAGTAAPTMRQAEDLARSFYIPFGYLWLSEPPVTGFPLPDLRTTTDEAPAEPSAALSDLIADVVWKQRWYRDYQQQMGEKANPLIGRYAAQGADIETVAADIRFRIGLDDDMRRVAKDVDNFLRIYIQRIEALGILVLRSSYVGSNTRRSLDVSEFRGFVISDPLAPLIFINGKDAKVAQVFTMTHELAHLWFGDSGVDSPGYRTVTTDRDNHLEKLCNTVAAETLVPARRLKAAWSPDTDALQSIQRLSKAFYVSRLVILRRARDIGLIGQTQYTELWRQITSESSVSGSSGESGDAYALIISRNGRPLIRAALSSLAEGRASSLDVANLLNISANKLGQLSEYYSRQN